MLTLNEFSDFMRETSYEIDLLSGKTNLPITNFLNKIGFPENYSDILSIDI